MSKHRKSRNRCQNENGLHLVDQGEVDRRRDHDAIPWTVRERQRRILKPSTRAASRMTMMIRALKRVLTQRRWRRCFSRWRIYKRSVFSKWEPSGVIWDDITPLIRTISPLYSLRTGFYCCYSSSPRGSFIGTTKGDLYCTAGIQLIHFFTLGEELGERERCLLSPSPLVYFVRFLPLLKRYLYVISRC